MGIGCAGGAWIQAGIRLPALFRRGDAERSSTWASAVSQSAWGGGAAYGGWMVEMARPLPGRDVRVLFDVLVVLEGELLSGQFSPGVTAHVMRRLATDGLIAGDASVGEFAAAIGDLVHRDSQRFQGQRGNESRLTACSIESRETSGRSDCRRVSADPCVCTPTKFRTANDNMAAGTIGHG